MIVKFKLRAHGYILANIKRYANSNKMTWAGEPRVTHLGLDQIEVVIPLCHKKDCQKMIGWLSTKSDYIGFVWN